MIKHRQTTIPTYEPGDPEVLPIFFEKKQNQGACAKVYPLPYTSSLSDTKIDKNYDSYILENDYIRVLLLPEIGGKIHSVLDKSNNYDIIYNNKVIKPAMVGICGPWVAGGIEFNWPQHHRPTTFMPLESKQVGNSVCMGEVDAFHNMHGTACVSIEESRSYVKVHAIVYNSTPFTKRFMWWANTAVEINDNYAVDFPQDVNYVNDHDRLCVFPWPIAKGVNATARRWDYGQEGVDIHFTKNIIPPTSLMISKDHCNYSFIAGYDYGKNAGVVMFGDNSTSVGKKLWIWGNNPFGHKWCENLTDDGSQYCELMTGVYTDNQPDFSIIEPYEMKEFDQYWYPIREIGEPKIATLDGAMNFEKTEKGLKVGLHMSGSFTNLTLKINESGKEVHIEKIASLSPKTPYIKEIEGKFDFEALSVSLISKSGKALITYQVKQPYHEPITPRPASPRPTEIITNEELFLHGYHLYQYDHFSYVAEDYFKEALRRDATDMRCNEAMGDISLDKGRFTEALRYYDEAIKKACLRNANPRDARAYYKRGLVHRYLNHDDLAIADFNHAIWQLETRSASYYALAGYEAKKGNLPEAISLLNLSLETNAKNVFAHYMKYMLDGNESDLETVIKIDPLFLHDNSPRKSLFLVRELLDFGLYTQASDILENTKVSPLVNYYRAFISHKLGDDNKAMAFIKLADKDDNKGFDYPNSLKDYEVLSFADSAMSHYYLGCLCYHHDSWAEACQHFERTISEIEYAPAYRNLALGYFDHLNRPKDAYEMLTKAFLLAPTNSRIFFEMTQLQLNMCFPIAERVRFMEQNKDMLVSRDDTLLKYTTYLAILGRYDDAASYLKNHSFHTYEGGEGQLTSFHSNLMYLLGNQFEERGQLKEALETYEYGLVYPQNYHETATLHVDNSHLYYSAARVAKKLGDETLHHDYLQKAVSSIAFTNPNFYFASLAARELRDDAKADGLVKDLLDAGESRIENCDLDAYFGVGAPARSPFAYDVKRTNTIKGLELKLFALRAIGRDDEEKFVKESLKKLDPSSMVLKLYNATFKN